MLFIMLNSVPSVSIFKISIYLYFFNKELRIELISITRIISNFFLFLRKIEEFVPVFVKYNFVK